MSPRVSSVLRELDVTCCCSSTSVAHMSSSVSPSVDAVLDYFARCQYDTIQPPPAASYDIVAEALSLNPSTSSFDRSTLESLFTYRTPNLSADGTCSLPSDLSPTPFNIAEQLYSLPLDSPLLPAHPATVRQVRLQHIVKALQTLTGCEWLGVYERHDNYSDERLRGHSTSDPHINTQEAAILTGASSGSPVNAAANPASAPSAFSPPTHSYPALIKLAYVGEPSRAVFPLTSDFEKLSGNTRTALQSRVHVIHDTQARSGDTPYYECSGRVRSECCVPILSRDGKCVGIIDAESWKVGVADNDTVVWQVGVVCQQLGESGLIGGPL